MTRSIRADEVRATVERRHPALEVAGDPVEADPARGGVAASSSRPGSATITIGRPSRDRGPSRPGRVAAAEPDVDAAGEVGAREVGRVAHVEHLRALASCSSSTSSSESGCSSPLERLLERRPLLRVEDGVVGEVGGRVGLVGRDEADELLPASSAGARSCSAAARRSSRPCRSLRFLPHSEPAPCAG